MPSIEEIMSRLDKKTLAKFRLGKDISKAFYPTSSLGLNLSLGGLPVGKQTTFYGGQQAGKSAIVMQTMGLNQKNGVGCGIIDAEKSFDYEWAAKLGVNTNEIMVSQVSTIAEMQDICSDWIKAGVGIIGVDSTTALMPDNFFEKDGVMKAFEETRQLGQFAAQIGKASRMVLGTNFETSFVGISQVRMDLGGSSMHVGTKRDGGKEVEHLDSIRIKLNSIKSRYIKDDVMYGDQLHQEVVGREVDWTIEKNKINGKLHSGTYNLITHGSSPGVDQFDEIISYGTKYGIVKKAGAWVYVYDEKFNGQAKAVDFLRENQDVSDRIMSDLEKIANG